MSIREIESAVTQLDTLEFKQFTDWFDEFRAQMWEKEIAIDSQVGRFDKLIQQAQQEFAAGHATEM